jgi:hypothetical protein
MSANAKTPETLAVKPASLREVEHLLVELDRRLMVVSDASLRHLLDRGVIARLAAGGCCKPDGGTCCPNKQVVALPGGLPERGIG